MDDLKISPLDSARRLALEAGLDFAARFAGAPRPLSTETVETLYNAFLAEQIDDNDAVIALGLSFGETFLAHGDFEWVQVVDEYGDETCLALTGKTLFCAPISMIKKRLARGERPDIRLLREATIEQILTQAEDADDR
jgi:hypothetical protein